MICSARDSELFQKAGWRQVYRGEFDVLLADAYRAIQGDKVNPFYWNFVWRSVADYLIDSGVLEPKGTDRIVLSLFRLLAYLSKYLFQFKKRAAKIRQSVGK